MRLSLRLASITAFGYALRPYLDFDPELAAWVAGIAGVIVVAMVELRRQQPVTREDLLALQLELARMQGSLEVLMGRPDEDADSVELDL